MLKCKFSAIQRRTESTHQRPQQPDNQHSTWNNFTHRGEDLILYRRNVKPQKWRYTYLYDNEFGHH